ncbi:MAG: hypothetical protein ABI780_02730 [Ardenticatenales bacterium]
MRTVLQRFWSDTSGAEMIEWALVTVVLLSTTMFIIILLQDEIMKFYETIFGALEKAPPDSFITPSTP